ncbi:hypothetical protein SLEP1_g30297 [Rubroshorea leprosula]|uniref:Transposase (putative) gypsy type domain-containing protein n=1 Tax=Rubroshorea leprosula TaxID=152421 RepID=A0AAV5K6C5_9ROSI|nr:hypothetical protein SLEP1_g30297 [Rubroshorea leprosula]
MASFHDAQGFQGNQGDEEDVDVISVEPIAMIVPPELLDSPRTVASESSTSLSAGGGSEGHRPSTFSDSPTDGHPVEWCGHDEGVQEAGGDGEAIPYPQNHPDMSWDTERAGMLSVADGLEYELALSQLTPNSIKFIISFMLLCERLGMPAKATVFRSFFLCRLCPSTSGTRWYYISGKEKMMIFTNIRNKLTVGDIDLKNRLLDHVKAKGLVDLEALVTPDQIALLGFVDVANLHKKGSARGHKAHVAAELGLVPSVSPALTSGHLLHRGAAPSIEVPARHRGRVPSRGRNLRLPALRDVPGKSLTRRMTSHSSGEGQVLARSPPQPLLRDLPACLKRQFDRVPRRYAGGYAELYAPHRLAAREGAHSTAWWTCCPYQVNGFESRADELARKVDELKEELQWAQVEKESGIQAAKEETGCEEDRAKKAEADKERTLHELNGLRERVSLADQHVARAEASLERTKKLHQRDVCFARAQRAEWLVGVEMFQDAVAVASANTTTDIFNEVRGKVLGVRVDFPIGELAFFEGEEIDADGKSLAQPADTKVKLKWELDEEGLPVWPPSVVEEGEDTEGLSSFDAWVADPHDVPAEPSSTPPSAPPQLISAAALAHSSSDRSSPARFASTPNDASIPVDLMDD